MGVEDLGYGSWITAAEGMPYGEVPLTYFGNPVPFDLTTVNAILVLSIAWAESARSNEKDAIKRIYPGFDPLGLAKGGLGRTGTELQVAEIKNGRCAGLRRLCHSSSLLPSPPARCADRSLVCVAP